MQKDETVFFMERCQSRDCPLTGVDNCNHAVRPGCKNYGVPIKFDISSFETGERPDSCLISRMNKASRNDGMIKTAISESDDRKLSPTSLKATEFCSQLKEASSNTSPCCNCHSNGRATCAALRSTCACRKAGRQCSSCFPLSKGKCSNHQEQSLSSLFATMNQDLGPKGRSIDVAAQSLGPFEKAGQRIEEAAVPSQSLPLADRKMIEAYGVPLLNSDGRTRDDLWGKIWERVTKLRGKLYSLPGGAIAKEFINVYDGEVSSFAEGLKTSESFVCFPSLIMQKDKNVKKTCEIRKLLKRRLQMWKDGLFLELIREAEQCSKILW